jgi:hypothetical protein
MPSPTFSRALVCGRETIDSNLASAVAGAKKNAGLPRRTPRHGLPVYASSADGRDRSGSECARRTSEGADARSRYFTALYATASIPSRLAIERHRWSDAAALTLPAGIFPGGSYAWTEADLYFARALGAARGRNVDATRSRLQQMTSFRDKLLEEHNTYSAEQVDIQRETVTAWMEFAESKTEDALRRMRAAAEHEDATESCQ